MKWNEIFAFIECFIYEKTMQKNTFFLENQITPVKVTHPQLNEPDSWGCCHISLRLKKPFQGIKPNTQLSNPMYTVRMQRTSMFALTRKVRVKCMGSKVRERGKIRHACNSPYDRFLPYFLPFPTDPSIFIFFGALSEKSDIAVEIPLQRDRTHEFIVSNQLERMLL